MYRPCSKTVPRQSGQIIASPSPSPLPKARIPLFRVRVITGDNGHRFHSRAHHMDDGSLVDTPNQTDRVRRVIRIVPDYLRPVFTHGLGNMFCPYPPLPPAALTMTIRLRSPSPECLTDEFRYRLRLHHSSPVRSRASRTASGISISPTSLSTPLSTRLMTIATTLA